MTIERVRVLKSYDDRTIFRVLSEPFGGLDSLDALDLHKEFFHQETDFGDDLGVLVKVAMYEHSMNTNNNPFMPADKQLIGKATFAKTDDWGRWYDFEVKRILEYHDYLAQLVKMGLMGGSSQCYPGCKTLDPLVPGKIDRWIASEESMTPTPANPTTLGKIMELVKHYNLSFSDAIKKESFRMPTTKKAPKKDKKDSAAEVVADASTPSTPITPDVTPDPVPDVTPESTPDVPPDPADGDIAAIAKELYGTTEDTAPEPEVDVKSLQEELASVKKDMAVVVESVSTMKAMFSVWLEIWGDTTELGETMATLQGAAKSMGSAEGRLSNIEKSLSDTQIGMGQMMKWNHNSTMQLMGAKFNKMTDDEKRAIGIDVDTPVGTPVPPTEQTNHKSVNSPIPAHAPGA